MLRLQALWSSQCNAEWPQVCEDVLAPTLESVRFSTRVGTTGVGTIHVSGYNFGDDNDKLAVKVGDMDCTGVEICHTVCRPCTSDAECGNSGLCLTVNNVAGSFCSVFCGTDNSCPCDTQCHTATANGMQYYFCLNPDIFSHSDLCNSAYRASQRHAEDVHNFRCEIRPNVCIPQSQMGVSLAIGRHATPWYWYSLGSMLSTAMSTASAVCSSATDCDDGEGCTNDFCVAGCCQHESTKNCITGSEGFKSAAAMMQYVIRNVTAGPWVDISSGGSVSSVSTVDDHPPEVVQMPFPLPFFDQSVTAISLNPNGMVNLGDTFSCVGPVFGSCTSNRLHHVVAMYFADFNPLAMASARVFHTIHQMTGLDNAPETTCTVQYQSIPLYRNAAPTSSEPVFTFALDMHASGRLSLRYHTIPSAVESLLPSSAAARTFIRSRQDLVAPGSPIGYAFPTVQSGTAINLCPVPKIACVSPACGSTAGGTVVTVTAAFFDFACLRTGENLGRMYCHFGAVAIPADIVSSQELRCVAPTTSTAGIVLFQLSWGDGTTANTELLDVNSVLKVGDDLSPVDPTFHYTESASSCGCSSVGHTPTLSCDVCGICGGTGDCFGCDGVFLSATALDLCGVCDGDSSSCAGCDGVPLSGATVDACGICGGNNATLDCYTGDCVGSSRFDDCGVCAGGTSGVTADADKDCAGVCSGLSLPDECSTCDDDSSNNCVRDCSAVWGGSASNDFCSVCSGGTTGVAINSTLDCVGVCGGAASFDDCALCSGGTSGEVANSDKDTCGVCSVVTGTDSSGSPTYDHVPESDQDCHAVCFGGAVIDYCGVCGGLNATLDCDSICDGPRMPDQCGVCGTPDTANPCALDCNGDWNLASESAAVDTCGQCSGGETGTLPNHSQDCHGVCFGSGRQDECEICDDNSGNDCLQDCHTVWGGTAAVDSCGDCSGGTTSLVTDAELDCAGSCGGTARLDNCAYCNSISWDDCLQDCQNVWGGAAYFDVCAICSGGTTGHVRNADRDCNSQCFGNATVDGCGVCSGGNTGVERDSMRDCAGVCFGDLGYDAKRDRDCNNACFGDATLDTCSVCSGGDTGVVPDSAFDCAGTCFGPHVLDQCGDCVNTNFADPCRRDCTGIWGGVALLDSCGQCTGTGTGRTFNNDQDCGGTCFGSAFMDSCSVCSGARTGHSPDSDRDRCGSCAAPGSGLKANRDEDCAGICFGSAKIDECGICTGGVTNKQENEDLGCDGVCFSGARDCQMLYWGPVIIITSGGLIGLTVITALIVLRRRLYRMRGAPAPADAAAIAALARGNGEDRQRRRQQHASRTRRILRNLVPFAYGSAEPDSFDNTQCSICLGDFEADEEVRRMPCRHTFHADCIENWIKLKHSCPLCVAPITTENSSSSGGVGTPTRNADVPDADEVGAAEPSPENPTLNTRPPRPTNGLSGATRAAAEGTARQGRMNSVRPGQPPAGP